MLIQILIVRRRNDDLAAVRSSTWDGVGRVSEPVSPRAQTRQEARGEYSELATVSISEWTDSDGTITQAEPRRAIRPRCARSSRRASRTAPHEKRHV